MAPLGKSFLVYAFVLLALCVLVTRAEDQVNFSVTEETRQEQIVDKDNTVPDRLVQLLIDLTRTNKQASEQSQNDQTTDISSYIHNAYSTLFPFTNPAWNSLLGTFYISSVPNFLLVLVPADLNLQSLNTMVSFATGGLLGDVFIHLLPEIFLPHQELDSSEYAPQIVIVEPKKNIILGALIFGGFASFFLLEKLFRVLGSDNDGHSHSHSHSHSHAGIDGTSSAIETTMNGSGSNLRERKKEKNSYEPTDINDNNEPPVTSKSDESVKLSAYLNLIADATHNVTDGLAMSAAFYTSPSIGATTTLAVFAHEIPHEVADYSILVKNGFSKKRALASQFITSVGAFMGTIIGIIIQEASSSSSSSNPTETLISSDQLAAAISGTASGIWGTSLTAGDTVVPFVAGGFLYIATVGVVPGLVEDSKNWKKGGATQLFKELLSMGVGLSLMFWIAWQDA